MFSVRILILCQRNTHSLLKTIYNSWIVTQILWYKVVLFLSHRLQFMAKYGSLKTFRSVRLEVIANLRVEI